MNNKEKQIPSRNEHMTALNKTREKEEQQRKAAEEQKKLEKLSLVESCVETL